jgi:hypothetical protein
LDRYEPRHCGKQHLQHLRRAGLVAARRDGKFVYYGLADDAFLDLVAALHRIAERNVAEVGRVLESYFRDRDSLEPVSRVATTRPLLLCPELAKADIAFL